MSDIPGLSRTAVVVLSAWVLSQVLAIGPVAAAEASGEADFRLSCSGCHGEDGRGGGSKAFGLSVAPPDLTTLRARDGGTFPRERLRRIIDGREDIKIHRDREMPVWGQLFTLDAEEGSDSAGSDDAVVRQRIERLIDFIESLQN